MRKVIFLICTIIMALGATNMAMGASEPKNTYYNQVAVVKGDTLWEIAAQHNDGTINNKDYVKMIKEINSMNGDRLLVGQKLVVPYFK